MQKQIFYIYKFKSSRLKEYDYNIELNFKDAQKNKEIISLFDSQLLRSVGFVSDKDFDDHILHKLKNKLKKTKNKKHSKDNTATIQKIQDEVNQMLFVPEIISIVMESKSDYAYLYKNLLTLNNKKYRRLSCSAGQARMSNVIFCEVSMANKLDELFDNGRDKSKMLVPSKFNAYKGLVSSSSSVVSTPRFCVIPDYISNTDVKVNFVTETSIHEDDKIEIRTLPEEFNRFDGQGLISVEQATKWAEELGLDYIPSQWCVRQNYLKGMLTTFDIKSFFKKENNGNFIVNTSYLNEKGEQKVTDLRNTDVIISESMFKLWNHWDSVESYQSNCKKNNLRWGVSLVSPKKDKDILKMNYQFLQTVNLQGDSIEKICKKFVDWIEGVTSKDVYYTMLFLLGTDVDEEKILKYIEKSENHWIKSLIVNPKLIEDKWIKKKIYDLMKNKIKNGCLGQILVDGNFTVLVSDPFAMMQHVCGHTVTGLLEKDEYYSNYWNKKGVTLVDSMRAPLTYRSEHVLLNLKRNKDMDYWYKHNESGLIVNVHGEQTMRWAGSDFDMDIIATTSDENILQGVYQDELPIMYIPPKSEPKKLTDVALYRADLHSFGSEIGQITNKSTSGYALLEQLEKDTPEYETTMTRIRTCTKYQSAQIDKAKIGRKVKSTPRIWQHYNYIDEAKDSPEEIERKKFLNKTLLNKHPYFFTYLYKNTRKKYQNYLKNEDITCRQKFGISINDLKKQNRKTKEQTEFLKKFYERSPVIDNDCVMNRICRHVESVDFNIRNIIKSDTNDELYKMLMSGDLSDFNKSKYNKILEKIKSYKDKSSSLASNSLGGIGKNGFDEEKEISVKTEYQILEEDLGKICSDVYELVDYLIYIFYVEPTGFNKEIIWSIYGDIIFDNVKGKVDSYNIPIPDENGEIEYLNKKYILKEVII